MEYVEKSPFEELESFVEGSIDLSGYDEYENSTDKFNERKKFVKWYDDFDQKRKLNLLETFPEYTNFYNYCKSL